MPRPVFNPEITLGTILSLLVMLVGLGGFWAATESRITKAEQRLDAISAADVVQQANLKEYKAEMREALSKIDAGQQRLVDRFDRLNEFVRSNQQTRQR